MNMSINTLTDTTKEGVMTQNSALKAKFDDIRTRKAVWWFILPLPILEISILLVLAIAYPFTRPRPKRANSRRLNGLQLLAVGALLGVLGYSLAACGASSPSDTMSGGKPNASGAAATSSAPSSSGPTAACATTWQMSDQTPSNGNWIADGVSEIQNAQTDADALKAANAWLDKVKQNRGTLVGAVKYLLKRDVDPATLADGKNCATEAASSLVTELQFTIANGKTTVTDAPANASNSGTANGIVVANDQPGIDGNRKAVAITLPDGTIVYVMARCGNAVTVGTPPVPTVPQIPGQPKPPAPPATCVQPPKPGEGTYTWNPTTCSWSKPAQSDGCMWNGGCGNSYPGGNSPLEGQGVDPTVVAQPSTRPTAAPPAAPATPLNPASPPRVTSSSGNAGGSTSNPITSGPPVVVSTPTETATVGCPPSLCPTGN